MRVTLEQYGTHCHRLRGDEQARVLFDWASRTADSVSAVLYEPRGRVLANPGKKVQRRLVPRIRELGLESPNLEFWSASRWLGTASSPCFMLRSGVRAAIVRLTGLGESVFWSCGHWQDLALYRGGRVVYYCTTHENEGAVFGTSAELGALSLDAVASAERWLVEGEPFDPESRAALIAALAEST